LLFFGRELESFLSFCKYREQQNLPLYIKNENEFVEAINKFGSGQKRQHKKTNDQNQDNNQDKYTPLSERKHKDSAHSVVEDNEDSVDYNQQSSQQGVKSNTNTTMNEYEIEVD